MKKAALQVSLLLIITFVSFHMPLYAAQVDGGPGIPNGATQKTLIPCGQTNPDECTFSKFVDLLNNVMNYLIILSIPVTAIMFTWIGVILLKAQGNPSERTRAKKIAFNVITGFVVILSAWALIRFITSQLVQDSFNQFMQK